MIDPYCYENSTVLTNKFGERDQDALDDIERFYFLERMQQPIPTGQFDLPHLQAIHHHLFQDVYEWAGDIRTVNISKQDSYFQPYQFIDNGMMDVHQRLQNQDFLQELNTEDFSEECAKIIGDVNYVHPFREGNGRTQLCYLDQLANQAGHSIDRERLLESDWIWASVQAQTEEPRLMQQAIQTAIEEPSPEKAPPEVDIDIEQEQ